MLVLIISIPFITFADSKDLIEIHPDFSDDHTPIKLTDREREKYVLKVNDFGLIIDPDTNTVADTRGVANGMALFVYQNNKIYLVVHRNYLKFNEITIAQRRPVSSAGKMIINRGIPVLLTESSAIYPNTSKSKSPLLNVVRKLSEMGINTSQLKVFFNGE